MNMPKPDVSYLIDPAHEKLDIFALDITRDVWNSKYRLQGEETPYDSLERAAYGVIQDDTKLADEVCRYMQAGLLMPAGRIHAGAGTDKLVTLMNCYVCRTITDSMVGIADALKDAMLTLQMGGGIGMDFSTIRPKKAELRRTGEGSWASGVLPFMDTWDAMCRTIMSAGARRGAMMATISDSHPDLLDFIDAKSQPGRLTNFNVSILVSDSFMDAVAHDEEWDLYFHVPPVGYRDPKAMVICKQFIDDKGVMQYVYKTVRAVELWERILQQTYNNAEPGVIFIDRVNELNNLQYCELIRCTNPCGEQPLPPNGACDLGAVNLARMVLNPFSPQAVFNWKLLDRCVGLMMRYLDAVIDVTHYPLKTQEKEQKDKRRTGLGISGLANALAMLGIRYGSEDAITFTRKVHRQIAIAAYCESGILAKEKGTFPLYNPLEHHERPFIKRLPNEVQSMLRETGLRNGVLLTIAPTGTTSIYYGNISSGIEPVFLNTYKRKVLQDDNTYKEYDVDDYGYALFRTLHPDRPLPDYFVTAGDLTVEEHVRMQAAAQEWVDASISKTINCPEEMPFDAFKAVYSLAFDLGCKGCTTYRPSETRGSVLSSGEERKAKLKPRPETLVGRTYQIKWPSQNSALYMTINNDESRKPFEIFFASKSALHSEWMTALSLMITAIFRIAPDPSFVSRELRQVVSAHDSGWIEGRFYQSLVALIADKIEMHLADTLWQGSSSSSSGSGSSGSGSGSGSTSGSTSTPGVGGTYVDPTQMRLDVSIAGHCSKCGAKAYIAKDGCGNCLSCGYSNCA